MVDGGGKGDFPRREITGHSALCDSPEEGGPEGFQGEASHGRMLYSE